MPFRVVLYEPEIPQNTGNIARLCAAVGAELHLVHPLGFYLDDRRLIRAGVDYWHLVSIYEHADWQQLQEAYPDARFWLAAGRRGRRYTDADYRPGDFLVFGPEGAGLPPELLNAHAGTLISIPMRPEARSLNVANAAAVILYEALRRRPPEWY